MAVERENTVAIIGGLGKMGVPTKRLFEQVGYETIISDIKDPQTLPPREAIRQSKIVFFSVLPLENVREIIQATKDVFRETHNVLDNASFKRPLKGGYQMLDRRGVSICSTHPLCKDDQPFFGQNVLIAPFGQNPKEATLIAENIYQKAGMVLIRVDFGQHDSLLLLNQLLPHLINRAVGLVLAETSVDIEALEKISTANSRLFNLALWRTLVQEPKISAMILENLLRLPEGKRIAQDFQQALLRLVKEQSGKGRLEKTFKTTIERLDPTGRIRIGMNEKTIVILERLANLGLRSITLEVAEDRVGLLQDILNPLTRAGINLNAIDSHRKAEGGYRFELGIESGEITPQVIKELEKMGCQVTGVTI